MGVTSFGRHTRPGCNLGHCRDLFCIKWCGWMMLTSIQCVFIDFRFHRHVTSGDVIHPPFPCEGSGNTLGGAAFVRGSIQHPVFSNLWPPMRGDWGAVWGLRTHKLTSCTYVSSYECVCSLPHAKELRADWSREVTWTTWWRIPMLISHVTLKTIPLLSLLRSDWLWPEIARITT